MNETGLNPARRFVKGISDLAISKEESEKSEQQKNEIKSRSGAQ